MPRCRVDAFAELLARGFRLCEAQKALGITKGQAASLMRLLCRELGEQAI